MISKRIRTIASLIQPHESVVDVGCDHGYLAIVLRQSGHTGKILGVDNKPGPLSHARANFAECGIDDVPLLLSEGLEKVEEPYDVIIMTGMGYNNIIHIMEKAPEYFKDSRLIIQVNTFCDRMRRWLTENGYMITDEVIMKEYRWYEIICAAPGNQVLDENEIAFGPVLLREKSPVFEDCWRHKMEKKKRILAGLPEDHPDREALESEIEKIEAIL